MNETKEHVIDEQNAREMSPEMQEVLDEWVDVTQEVKAVILRKLKSLAKDGDVGRVHLVSAVSSLSLAIGQLIALMENEELEDNLIHAFSDGVKMAVLRVKLEKLEKRMNGYESERSDKVVDGQGS